jgi:argininosuccinate lyase
VEQKQNMMNAAETKARALKLADWLKAEGVDFDDAAPILAMTLGLIIGKQAQGAPEEHVDKGVEIMSEMIRVAAIFEAKAKGQNESSH